MALYLNLMKFIGLQRAENSKKGRKNRRIMGSESESNPFCREIGSPVYSCSLRVRNLTKSSTDPMFFSNGKMFPLRP